jgi:hypothetical protein
MAESEDQDTESEKPEVAAAAVEAPAPESPKKGRGLAGRLVVFLLLIAALLAGAGYGALIFRDKDERIEAAATVVEAGTEEARALWDNARARIAGLTGEQQGDAQPESAPRSGPADSVAETTTRDSGEATQALKSEEKHEEQTAEKPAEKPPESPTPSVGAGAETQNTVRETAIPAPETVKGPEKEQATEPTREPVTAAPPGPGPALTGRDFTALSAKLEETAELARRALAAAEQAGARAAGGAHDAARKDELSALDLASALEGRIDTLGDELKSLRERLESPKNETRAAPVAGGSSGEAATVVIAFALQKELAAGRPFVDEIAALQRTGADPALLAALVPMAETGAPTGAALHALFVPFEKKIRAEEHAAGQDLATHILHGASKLVRVRPSGETHSETPDGYLARIDSALTHDDFIAAQTAFDALPEADRAQAGEFADLLRKRASAEKAAYDLLHGAIAALGGVKK